MSHHVREGRSRDRAHRAAKASAADPDRRRPGGGRLVLGCAFNGLETRAPQDTTPPPHHGLHTRHHLSLIHI